MTSARLLLRTLLLIGVAGASVVACGEPEGPAVEVFLQVTRGDGVDTSEVTGFFVLVGGAGRAIAFDESNTVPIELEAPPEADTAIIVYGCTFRNATCNPADALFIGCTVKDLAPSDDPVVAEVVLQNKNPLPEACEAIGAE